MQWICSSKTGVPRRGAHMGLKMGEKWDPTGTNDANTPHTSSLYSEIFYPLWALSNGVGGGDRPKKVPKISETRQNASWVLPQVHTI